MKRLLAVMVIALVSGAATVKAQVVELIPKAGISVDKQVIKGANGEKSKVGFQGGLAINIRPEGGAFSIQPELNFVSKGVAFKPKGGKKETYNTNYLEIPVLAKYSFGSAYVNAGPALGFRLGETNKVKSEYGGLKKIDFGVQFGAGLAIPAGSGKVIVDGRYALGLSNISDFKGGNVKNRGFMASVGYAIPLTKKSHYTLMNEKAP